MRKIQLIYFSCDRIAGKQRRLKQAKEEAQEEIEKYRTERDRQFKEFEAKVKLMIIILRHSMTYKSIECIWFVRFSAHGLQGKCRCKNRCRHSHQNRGDESLDIGESAKIDSRIAGFGVRHHTAIAQELRPPIETSWQLSDRQQAQPMLNTRTI